MASCCRPMLEAKIDPARASSGDGFLARRIRRHSRAASRWAPTSTNRRTDSGGRAVASRGAGRLRGAGQPS